MSYIYVITNDINKKQYIGKTNLTIEKRFKEHIYDSKKERCEKRPLYNAMNKYGIEHFSIEQLEECNESIVNEREQYWIQKLNTYGKTGYNATLGGDSKHYYNYQEIVNKYLELQNQKETAKYFDCDVETVRKACLQYKISIKTSQQQSRELNGKNVKMLPENIDFECLNDAGYYLIEKGFAKTSKENVRGVVKHIRDVCNGKRKIAYKHQWMFI